MKLCSDCIAKRSCKYWSSFEEVANKFGAIQGWDNFIKYLNGIAKFCLLFTLSSEFKENKDVG